MSAEFRLEYSEARISERRHIMRCYCCNQQLQYLSAGRHIDEIGRHHINNE
jgi:hypothetical protein